MCAIASIDPASGIPTSPLKYRIPDNAEETERNAVVNFLSNIWFVSLL
jgi:hypothetical protein